MKGASIDWHQHLVERRRSHEAVELKKCFVLVSMGGGRSIFTMPDTFSTDSSELDGLTDGTDGGLDNLSMGVAGFAICTHQPKYVKPCSSPNCSKT